MNKKDNPTYADKINKEIITDHLLGDKKNIFNNKNYKEYNDKEIYKKLIDKTPDDIITTNLMDNLYSSLLKYFATDNSETNSPNFLNYRILKYKYYKQNEENFFKERCDGLYKTIIKNKNILSSYDYLSKLVINKKQINFPILYDFDFARNIGYFENNELIKINMEVIKTVNRNYYEQIAFQKLYIIYILSTLGLYSPNFYFLITNIREVPMDYKIGDIYFNIKLSYLVTLDPRTELENYRPPDCNYLLGIGDKVSEFITTSTDAKIIMYFFLYFNKYLRLELFRIPSNIKKIIKKTFNIGDLVILDNGQSGVIVDSLLGSCKIILFIGMQKDAIGYQTTIVENENLFESNISIFSNDFLISL